jgi:MFS family permease
MASICCFAGQMLSYVAMPFYLQHTLRMSPVEAGLYMIPWPLAVTVVAPIAGRLANFVKTAWLCATGGALLAAGLAIVGLGAVDARGVTFLVGTVIAGIGFGLFQTPNNRILLLSAPKARSGAAGAMQGTARLTGQTFGAILMTMVFALVPYATAPSVALVLAAACAGLAALISLGRAIHAAWSLLQRRGAPPAQGSQAGSRPGLIRITATGALGGAFASLLGLGVAFFAVPVMTRFIALPRAIGTAAACASRWRWRVWRATCSAAHRQNAATAVPVISICRRSPRSASPPSLPRRWALASPMSCRSS